MSNRNVPELRLDRFKGEWERQNVASISKPVTRVTPSSTAPVMMISAASGFIPQSNKYSSDNAGKSLSKYIELHQDELAYNHGASKLRQFGSCFKLDVPAARVPFVYHCFQVLEDDPTFVGFSLNRDSVQEQLRRLVSSGARMDGLLNISFEQYGTVEVSLPPTLEEQQAIGAVFTNLDAAIDQHTDKHRVLQRTKTALMQKMFPQDGQTEPELRLDGFEGEWEESSVGKEAPVTMGQSPAGDTYRTTPSEMILVQGNADMENGWVKPRVWTTQPVRTATAGTLIMSVRAPVGAIGKTQYPVALGRGVAGIEGNDFIFHYLGFLNQSEFWNRVSSGSTFESVNGSTIRNTPITLPPTVEEQQAIGAVFTKLDTLISAEAQLIEKLKQTKTALLQKMFV